MAPLEVDSKYMMDRQWMDEWMDGLVDGWVNGWWMDGQIMDK